MKLRHLLPILNTVFLAVVASAFVQSHGGVKGDYTYLGSVTDAPTEPGDYGRVFFNRWQFYGDRETALTQSFLLANIPGFGAAKATLWIFRSGFEEFQTSYPFGLSYASYSLLLGFPFSLLQWFGIGALLDWLRRRSALAMRALPLMIIWLSACTAAATTSSPVGLWAECGYDGYLGGKTMTFLGAPTVTFRVLRTGPLQFTGKERDAETGLDYFGARYLSAAMGKFTSPDAPFADQHPSDPQSWNLYAYTRNSPLKFVDPTGESIQLTGATEEDRQKELAAIQAALGNSKASGSLYINPELDQAGKQTGRFFVGINGDASAFAKAGDLESGLAGIIGDKNIVQFGFGEKATIYDDSTPNFLRPLTFLSTQTLNVGQRFGGGLTLHGSITMSVFIQSMVDPGNLRDRTAEAEGIPGANLGEAVAHELIGHAGAFLRGQMGAPNNQRAVNAENAARARGGPSRGQKRSH